VARRQKPPQPDHPLLTFDNVIVSPHNAGMTEEALHDMAAAAAAQWIDIFAGAVPPRLVNPEAWPVYAGRFERIFGFAPAPLLDVARATAVLGKPRPPE
jgi:D-3-phosphoglycerate dehydrogenase